MPRNLVALVALERAVKRGGVERRDLSCVPYAMHTWEWWCRKHDVDFTVVENSAAGACVPHAPATVLRWFAARDMIGARAVGTKVALVDADTMIRWDTPNFFALASSGINAVNALSLAWVSRSMAAFQPLFPGVALSPQRYFNAGFVVLGHPQLRVLSEFCQFYMSNEPALQSIFGAGDFGTDQTPLNFVVHAQREPISFLPKEYNFLHCYGRTEDGPFRPTVRLGLAEQSRALAERAFRFIELGYVWHFTNVVRSRTAVMRETWHRVERHYV